MQVVVTMRFGSHLYGTDTVASDLDLKGVYLPAARDILLQQVKSNINLGREKAPRERNLPGEVDHDLYSLQRYLDLLAGGQTIALDMLFAPDSALVEPPHPCWLEIRANSHRLVSRRAGAFVHYCRQQANKYGIKGSRIAAARQALDLLIAADQHWGGTAKLAEAMTELEALATANEHIDWLDLPSPAGPDGASKLVRNLVICGRKMPLTASIKNARDIAQRLVDEYGQRAQAAERNEGIDWKALSHAIRVGQEALELFRNHRIDFPLACAARLRAIKAGLVRYEDVTTEIEDLLIQIEQAAEQSTLPADPDQAFIDDLVARYYRSVVIGEGTA